jgi:GTPase
MDPSPTIAIVGRPNVGKSTLFNRLVGKRQAVVANEAGTTRDRISETIEEEGYRIHLVDTGGLEHDKQENIEEDVQTQAQIAINESDLIYFIVDISKELTVNDFAAADILRKSEKTVLLIANKSDSVELEDNIFNFYELGFGDPIRISAIHKIGIDELRARSLKEIKKLGFKKYKKVKDTKYNAKICFLGKPNAGKSSLVNALLGSDQVIVSDIPGTTRDSTDTELQYEEKLYKLIDTAGLKRPGRTKVGVEKFSAMRSISSTDRSDIVVLLIDGDLGITAQDTHIAECALEAQKGIIIAVNKLDLIEKDERKKEWIIRRLRRRFGFIPWAPVIFLSAKNKKNINKILDLSDEIMQERAKRISTAELNSFFQKITQKHLPASRKIAKPKFMYGSQVDVSPPKFLLFFKNPQTMHFSYPRYLENEIRKEYGFNGTCISIKLKNKNEGQLERKKPFRRQ